MSTPNHQIRPEDRTTLIAIMAFKYVLLCAFLAVAKAGLSQLPLAYVGGPALAPAPTLAYSAAPSVSHVSYSSPVVSYGVPFAPQIATPSITSQSSNILRTFGNLGQVSTYHKSIDTPFSSVRKADVRISNPGLKISAAPAIAYAAPAIAHPLGVAYSAAPAVAHVSYSNSYGLNYAF